MPRFSLLAIGRRFKWRISVTIALMALAAGLELLFPLAIGIAVDGLLEGDQWALWPLLGLGIGALLVGTAQRFYDTRIYAGIYQAIAPEMVESEQLKGTEVSGISARTSLLTEFVEFLEGTMPQIVSAVINLAGALVLIAYLDTHVFVASLLLLLLMALIFSITGSKNFKLNAGYNDELEEQVKTLANRDSGLLRTHLKRLMDWNIRLSDLETLNYFVLFLGVIALLTYTPWVVVQNGVLAHGMVISVLMYVLSYIDSLVTCPLFIQQIIRLQEISQRLSSETSSETPPESLPKDPQSSKLPFIEQ